MIHIRMERYLNLVVDHEDQHIVFKDPDPLRLV